MGPHTPTHTQTHPHTPTHTHTHPHTPTHPPTHPHTLTHTHTHPHTPTHTHMTLHCHFLKTKQGIPSWKFDDNLLTDSDYTNSLEHILRDSLIEHTTQGHQHDFSSTQTNNIQTHLDYQNNNPTFLLQAVITKINSFTKQYMEASNQKVLQNR